jgi:heme-degrading monooxygenase HmoA
MVQFVWEFTARVGKVKEFERHYASNGPWAELFRKSAGYQGTQLLRDIETERHYLAIDRWDSVSSHVAMRDNFAKEYEELDRLGEELAEGEGRLGVFEQD